MQDDFEYFSRRAEQENQAAIRSDQPAAVLAHRSLSLLYKDRAAASMSAEPLAATAERVDADAVRPKLSIRV